MITPAQCAETLSIPASTIRRWANRFAPYLSEQRGKKRSYTISDLDIFRQIHSLSSQGLSLDQIADSLKVREPDQVKGVELLALDDFAQALEHLFAFAEWWIVFLGTFSLLAACLRASPPPTKADQGVARQPLEPPNYLP